MQLKQLRDPKPNKVSFRTIYYSTKHPDPTQQAQIGESMLENSLITLLEHDPDVLKYLNQAVPKNCNGEFKPLTYRRNDGVIEEWTPDFSVIWKNRKIMIIEVKPLSRILEKRTFLTDKWQQTKELAKKNNWDFLIFTDAFKSISFRVDNLMDLESQTPFATKKCQKSILEIVHKIGDSYVDLVNIVGEKITNVAWSTRKLQIHLSKIGFLPNEVLASVFKLIYRNKLYIDLEKEFHVDTPLSVEKSLYVPLRAWLMDKNSKEGLLGDENLNFIDEKQLENKQSSLIPKDKFATLFFL